LSLAVRDQLDRPEPAMALPAPQQQVSKLLPVLMQGLDTGRPLTILDLGRALPETVNFFSRLRCKVYLPDLYGELQSGRVDRNSTNKTLQRQFQELFAFAPGTCLDLCLLWDLPHYLDEKLLRAFSSALWPWLSASSVAHGFGVHSAATILLNREYGIIDQQTLSVRYRAAEQLKNSPHPQSFMSEWLTCFTAGSGVLLADGKVETLFCSTV
jgi:hypothetical protein